LLRSRWRLCVVLGIAAAGRPDGAAVHVQGPRWGRGFAVPGHLCRPRRRTFPGTPGSLPRAGSPHRQAGRPSIRYVRRLPTATRACRARRPVARRDLRRARVSAAVARRFRSATPALVWRALRALEDVPEVLTGHGVITCHGVITGSHGVIKTPIQPAYVSAAGTPGLRSHLIRHFISEHTSGTSGGAEGI